MELKDILTTIVVVVIILLIYYVSFAERKRQEKNVKKMQDELKKGDKVVTFSGLSGVITEIEDDRIIIEANPDKIKLSIEKWAIAGLDDRDIK